MISTTLTSLLPVIASVVSVQPDIALENNQVGSLVNIKTVNGTILNIFASEGLASEVSSLTAGTWLNIANLTLGNINLAGLALSVPVITEIDIVEKSVLENI